MDASIDESVEEKWQEVVDDKSDTAWVLAGYEGKKITVKGSGCGGRSECLAAITDDTAVFFGAFRLNAIDNRGSTVSTRPKFCIFFYRAANAPSMQKAKAGRHMGAIEQTFHGYHVMFQVDELHEMSEAEIVKKLRAAGGAHQPTGYDFGHGDAGEGAEEVAPEKAAPVNPADAAPMFAKAPKPDEEGALRAKAYMAPHQASVAPEAGAAAAPPVTAAMAALSTSDDKPLMSESGRTVVVLVTSMPSTTVIEGNQASLRQILKTKLATATKEVDGVLPENKDTRSALFECSGKRGAYPQVFILEKDGKYTNVGDFDEIQSLNDTDTLPPDVLAANPEIPTFKKAFLEFIKA